MKKHTTNNPKLQLLKTRLAALGTDLDRYIGGRDSLAVMVPDTAIIDTAVADTAIADTLRHQGDPLFPDPTR